MTGTTSRFPQGSSTVVGYFANGEDAHRAIHALLNDGFESTQIGAAFNTTQHGSSSETLGAAGGESLATHGKSVSYPDLEPSDTGVTTTTADYTSVTPALGGGSGTGMAGAGKPGPITGSDLSNLNLPHEIKSTLAHDVPGETPLYTPPGTGSFTESHSQQPGWLEKLSRVFSSRKHKHGEGNDLVNSTSQNFGTGEGHLGITPAAEAGFTDNYSRRYSHSAFENSFTGLGLPEAHSRHLALRLAHGGAVVMIGVTGRIVEAEKILEENNGTVRFAGEQFTDALPAGDHRVAVFGAVDDVYPATEEVSVPTVLHSR